VAAGDVKRSRGWAQLVILGWLMTAQLCACDERFRPGGILGLTAGQSTMMQARTILGTPDSVASSDDGKIVEWLYRRRPPIPNWADSINIVVNVRTQKVIRIEVFPSDGSLEAIKKVFGCPAALYCYLPMTKTGAGLSDQELCRGASMSSCDWLVPSKGAYVVMPSRVVVAIEFWPFENLRRNSKRIRCSR
jgi:hypothetical protein